MKIIILSARILAAARIFHAKNDCRLYLNGIHVEKHRITASNGATMFFMPNKNPFFEDTNFLYTDKGFIPTSEYEPFTFKISGSIPASAEQAALIFLDEESGYIEYFGYTRNRIFGKLDHKTFFNIIPDAYANIDKVISTFVNKPVSEFGINPAYLSFLEKCCNFLSGKRNGNNYIKVLTPGNNQAICFEHQSKLVEDVTATILIMPMRA